MYITTLPYGQYYTYIFTIYLLLMDSNTYIFTYSKLSTQDLIMNTNDNDTGNDTDDDVLIFLTIRYLTHACILLFKYTLTFLVETGIVNRIILWEGYLLKPRTLYGSQFVHLSLSLSLCLSVSVTFSRGIVDGQTFFDRQTFKLVLF